MTNVTFITGNPAKAEFLAKYLDHPIKHHSLDLEEIQSLSLQEVAEHKAKQAYQSVKSSVLIEDAGLTIHAMGSLPGPFIKWFHQELGLDGICRLVDGLKSRAATMTVCFAYLDGQDIKFFNGALDGQIADLPKGSNGFGFDPIFIPTGRDKTLAQMTDAEMSKYSLRTTTVYPQIKKFLASLDKA